MLCVDLMVWREKKKMVFLGLVTSQATWARLGLGLKKARLGLSSCAKRAELEP